MPVFLSLRLRHSKFTVLRVCRVVTWKSGEWRSVLHGSVRLRPQPQRLRAPGALRVSSRVALQIRLGRARSVGRAVLRYGRTCGMLQERVNSNWRMVARLGVAYQHIRDAFRV